jgi:hypothetical protein
MSKGRLVDLAVCQDVKRMSRLSFPSVRMSNGRTEWTDGIDGLNGRTEWEDWTDGWTDWTDGI